ncbi:MAG: hypothetical protein ACJ72I_18625 [Pseudonocardiaceae bacterium]
MIGVLIAFYGSPAWGWITGHLHHDPTPTGGRTVIIYNKTTNGNLMEEDTPAYLSTRTVQKCIEDGCAVPKLRYHTGDRLKGVTCQTSGDVITNGSIASHADDHNPHLATSRLWYGVRLSNGKLVYLSEVWVAPQYRGGMGLPKC